LRKGRDKRERQEKECRERAKSGGHSAVWYRRRTGFIPVDGHSGRAARFGSGGGRTATFTASSADWTL
jgi:hypothetical protein